MRKFSLKLLVCVAALFASLAALLALSACDKNSWDNADKFNVCVSITPAVPPLLL